MSEALITIHSVIENLDGTLGAERTQTEARGELSFGADGVILTWSEESEGGKIESRIVASEGSVSVTRSGAIESSLFFKEGEISESLYKVGPYAFDSRIRARRVRVRIDEAYLSATVIYEMELGGESRLVKMKIKAESCESEDGSDGA